MESGARRLAAAAGANRRVRHKPHISGPGRRSLSAGARYATGALQRRLQRSSTVLGNRIRKIVAGSAGADVHGTPRTVPARSTGALPALARQPDRTGHHGAKLATGAQRHLRRYSRADQALTVVSAQLPARRHTRRLAGSAQKCDHHRRQLRRYRSARIQRTGSGDRRSSMAHRDARRPPPERR